ncbi:fimbrial protein [Erwinia pyrifoliae]|uniref:fimbrial protein n=1 Tax=Erwinia pyrifoliae TaxID=79967 RepID=UPI0021BE02F2|nr:fimbrial protein [Erwinia pyrifoliae]UXK10740.1 fimbrial protein [Erwinia pyrifoliae]
MKIFNRPWLMPILWVASTFCAAEPFPGSENGMTKPPDTRCIMTVGSPLIDYGVMSRWQLQDIPGGNVSPGIRSTTVSVVCPHSRTIKLLVQGDANETGHLRYGERGHTLFHLSDVQLDGKPADLRSVMPDGMLEDAVSEPLPLTSGQRLVTLVNGQVTQGKTLTARLQIQPVLSEEDARASSLQRSASGLTLMLVD